MESVKMAKSILFATLLMISCGGQDELITLIQPLTIIPGHEVVKQPELSHYQLPRSGICADDWDCRDRIWCNGAEWCCYDWRIATRGCQKNRCYAGISPCGIPMWEMDTICSIEFCDQWPNEPCHDECRNCRADFECDDGHWCNGRELCVGGNWGYKACQRNYADMPCPDIMLCHEEKHYCAPECLRDSQCGLEQYCDENGKCQNY